MKKTSFMALFIAMSFSFIKLSSQSSSAVNNYVPGNFLGWNAVGPGGFLDIRNDHNFPIRFYTSPFQFERFRIWQPRLPRESFRVVN